MILSMFIITYLIVFRVPDFNNFRDFQILRIKFRILENPKKFMDLKTSMLIMFSFF